MTTKHIFHHLGRALSALLLVAMLLSFSGAALAASGDTTRVSIATGGTQADGDSYIYFPSISADGRYVAFESDASNLVAGDTNNGRDIFVRDRQTNQTTRVSVDSSGTEADGGSYANFISADGRYVAFHSSATNLVSGDTNGLSDVFVHDRQTSQTTRVSVDSSGVQGGSDAYNPSISTDGRYVTFESEATNLVSGDTNGLNDIFVRDRQTNQTIRVSVDSSGIQGDNNSHSASISADGHYVVFYSYASNLVSGDTNSSSDIFVRDLQTNQTSRVSVNSSGVEGDSDSFAPSISADGRYVAFHSFASNLVSGDTNNTYDIFVRDRQTGQTSRVSIDSSGVEGNSNSYNPSISADGRYVAFASESTNLVSGVDSNLKQDIFIHDRQTGDATRISVDSSGTEGNNTSYNPSISADGIYVAFSSSATNLVSGDSNGVLDIFVHENDVPTATFSDVPLTYWASSYIERLYNASITGGCSAVPLNYCPDSSVTRAQMAIFLLKGIHGSSYSPPAVGVSTGFGDVATDYWAAAWIKQLAAEGVTSGCGNGNYCPDSVVTRAQMAVFLLKAKNGSSYSPPAVGVSTGFNDVATDAFAAAFIKQLVADGITAGCGNSNYCPNDSVTRAQMAVFLVRAFNLP